MKKAYLPITVTIIATIVTCIGVVFGILALIFGILKSHPAYRMGMELVKNDPAVIELFGSPVEDGFWVAGTIRGFRYSGDIANLETSISGSRARGTVGIFGSEVEGGVWRIMSMSIHVGDKLVLVYSGSEPEKGFQPVR
jgi:hypothetical protein